MLNETKKREENEEEGAEMKLYETGYHFLPTLSEEVIGEKVSHLRDSIESIGGGVIISEETPKMIQLAYPLPRIIFNKKKLYESAYFGWFKFQALPERVPTLREELKKNNDILRFLMIKVVSEKAARPPKKMKFFASAKPDVVKDKRTPERPITKEKELSESELDKTIEELIVE